MNAYKKVLIGGIVIMAVHTSCTRLDEQVYSDLLQSEFYQTEQEIIAALAPAYGGLRGIESLMEAATLATDETVIPTRGKDWYDGGIYLRLHEHNWQPQLSYFRNIWNYGFGRVNQANQLLFQLANVQDKIRPELYNLFVAELKLIRAFGYYELIDHFGNVPILDKFDVPTGFLPKNNSNFEEGRKEVFSFIEKDILENIAALSAEKNQSTYGRFNQYAAYALLAKLYLNAETWTGSPKWDETIAACDAIIGSGKYMLESNYFNNFLAKNEGSKENIFVIPYDGSKTDWQFIVYWTSLHPSMKAKYNTTNGPWNGLCALPSHYKSFDPDDKRRNGWIAGPQFSSTGAPLKCVYESVPHDLNLTVDFVNIYNPSDPATYNHINALEYHGARFVKYEISRYPSWCMENDRVIFRLGDIILMKAEALMRKNGGVAIQEAVDLVNNVRERAFDDPASHAYTTVTLTLDQLLKERAWELYFEGVRRNDLVRFGKFVRGTWEFADRSAEGDHQNVYPIPQSAMNSNPELVQNPGY